MKNDPKPTSNRSRKATAKPSRTTYPAHKPSENLALNEMAVSYGLKQQTLSRMSGFSLRAVAHWLAGRVPSEAAKTRLTELNRLLKALSAIVQPAMLEAWFQKPNPAFQGSTPLQVVERGEIDRLWRMLYELGSGEPH